MKKLFLTKLWEPVLILALILIPWAAGHAQELAAEQVCRIGVGVNDIGTVDPHFSVKYGEANVYRSVYESLLRFPPGEMNPAKIQPSLAESWEIAPDKLTWTFHLRKGVQWHENYGEFKASDVKFSLDRIRDPKVGAPFLKNLDMIDEVKVVDDYTVQVKTKYVVPDMPSRLVDYQAGYIVSEKAVEKLGQDIKFHPVGTGPFMFHTYKPRERYVLVPNPNYWRGKPILKRYEIYFMPDNSTRELALMNGEVDGIEIPAKQEWVERLRKAGFQVDLTAPANTFALHFNMTQKPLDDIRVRQALCHAINRTELINFLGKDVARPEISPLPSGYVGHTEDVVRYDYDPAKAKKLLAEAGHPNGFSLAMNISNSTIYLPPMQVIQEQWKKIGVNLELRVVDHPTYHKLIRQDANPVVIYGAFRMPMTGDVYLTQFYHSESIIGKKTAIINFSHYGEAAPPVDKYLDEARKELDVNKQIALWTKAQQEIKANAASFPLMTRLYANARSQKLDAGFPFIGESTYRVIETCRILK